MSAPNHYALEEPLRRLRGMARILMRTADGFGNSEDGEALNFLADAMAKDVGVVTEWFHEAHAAVQAHHAAKGSGPRAVS